MAFSTSHNAQTTARATMQVNRNRGLAQRRSAAAIPPVKPPLMRKMTDGRVSEAQGPGWVDVGKNVAEKPRQSDCRQRGRQQEAPREAPITGAYRLAQHGGIAIPLAAISEHPQRSEFNWPRTREARTWVR